MRRAAFLSFAVMCAGCQFDPYAHLYTTVRPAPVNVVGKYRLTRQTVTPDGLAALKGKPCVVDLREDGTFDASNVPPPMVSGNTPDFFSRLVSVSGTWRLDGVGSVGSGGRSSQGRWGVAFDADPTKVMSAGLTGEQPPYGLIFTLGDPDSGDVLILEKAP